MESRPRDPNRRLARFAIAALVALSGFSSVYIFSALTAFDQTAGPADPAPPHWPASSALARSGARPDLLVFVHPLCACTVATLDELARIPAKRRRSGPSPALHILFEGSLKDTAPGRSGLLGNALWEKARSIRDAGVTWDEGDREARLFGAQTSGYTMLYSAEGDLLFHGGVTGSRGHQGDNKGLEQLVAALDLPPGVHARSTARSFVFGCALLSSAARQSAAKERAR